MTGSKKTLDKNTLICAAMFIVYAVLTLIGALRHEIWFDEAEAWNIARDNDIAGIFSQLKYEGHPPLWYLILYIPSHLGMSCTVLPFISWFFSVITAAVLLFKSPFGNIMKAAVVFSGGMLFFNSVISRVYCLINLVLVLIAWIYPKRKEHPIIFGVLVALLANTHVCMSGLVGIFGIFMIIDLFKDWKHNTFSRNAGNIIGLGVSGIGVLMLVIPLLNSLQANEITQDNEYSLSIAVKSVLSAFYNIAFSSVSGYYDGVGESNIFSSIFAYIWVAVLAFFMYVQLILMRHKTKAFTMMIFFCIFYIVSTEIIWVTIPNRAYVFFLTLAVILWISTYEEENKASAIWDRTELKAETGLIQKIIDLVVNSDKNFYRSCCTIIAVISISSVPITAYYLFSDYAGDFCPSEVTADYIRDNFTTDTVFVSESDSEVQFSAYLPEYRFYSLDYSDFYSYKSHKAEPETAEYNKIYNDLKDCSDIYILYSTSRTESVSADSAFDQLERNIIYSYQGGLYYGINVRYVDISEFNIEDLDIMVEEVNNSKSARQAENKHQK